MTTFTNNLNQELFIELTPAESAVIQGGLRENIDLGPTDYTDNTTTFNVGAGEDIKLSSFTKYTGNYNSGFLAKLVNADDQQAERFVNIFNDTNYWNNVKGGKYYFEFKDSDRVGGVISGSRGNDSIVVSSGNY